MLIRSGPGTRPALTTRSALTPFDMADLLSMDRTYRVERSRDAIRVRQKSSAGSYRARNRDMSAAG
jgi:hypothetical protein